MHSDDPAGVTESQCVAVPAGKPQRAINAIDPVAGGSHHVDEVCVVVRQEVSEVPVGLPLSARGRKKVTVHRTGVSFRDSLDDHIRPIILSEDVAVVKVSNNGRCALVVNFKAVSGRERWTGANNLLISLGRKVTSALSARVANSGPPTGFIVRTGDFS